MGKIRVLVVDDSAFMRKVIPQILQEDADIEIIGTAKDGKEALKKTIELKPDVITLDVEMPKLDGLKTLGYIMSEKPTPVIMLSAYTPRGAETTLQALEYGAVDFVCKPSGEISLDIKKVQKELIEKIKTAKGIDVSKLTFILPESIEKKEAGKQKEVKNSVMVIIAASTGGPRALTEVIPRIERNLPASFLIIQHMSAGFTKTLADRLNRQSLIKVKEAEKREVVKAGTAYLAPGNYNMEIQKKEEDYIIELNQKPTRHGVRPSADITIFSAVKNFHGKLIEVVLTGMGKDGSSDLEKIKGKKGTVITQDKETSVIFGMPRVAMEKGTVDIVKPIDKIADTIISEINKFLEDVK